MAASENVSPPPAAEPDNIFQRVSGTLQAPWEIGRAQPAILKLVQQGAFQGRIIDIGCGVCDNAIEIAKTGVKVTGFDVVERAVVHAQKRVAELGLDVEVVQADVFNLASSPIHGRQFDTALDCGIFHIWDNALRLLYRDALSSLVKPGGLYLMLVFSEHCPDIPDQPLPRRVAKQDVLDLFGPQQGWRVEGVEETRFVLHAGPDRRLEEGAAYLCRIRRLP